MGRRFQRSIFVDKQHLVGRREYGETMTDEDDQGGAMVETKIVDNPFFRRMVDGGERIVEDDEGVWRHNALARLMRAACPPESRTPPGPTIVLIPCFIVRRSSQNRRPEELPLWNRILPK